MVHAAAEPPTAAGILKMQRLRLFPVYLVLGVWFVFVTVPLGWVLINALRSSREFAENPFGLPWLLSADATVRGVAWAEVKLNFWRAWVENDFGRFFVNSVVVTAFSLAAILLLGSMTAYALTHLSFRGKSPLYLYFILGLMVPPQLLVIPLFFEFTTLSRWGTRWLAPLGYELHLHDSLTGLVLVYIALSLPFTVLVLRNFFATLPTALREAALLEGASEWRIFWSVMLPLARPGLLATGILNFIGIWNEYLFAQVLINTTEKKTLPLGLASVSMQAQYKTDFGLMFAGLFIVVLPSLLIYLWVQRYITRGALAGALKG